MGSPYDSPFLQGGDVFGESAWTNPTAPEAGPFIGRGEIVSRGKRVQVFRSDVMHRAAQRFVVCLVRRDAKASNAQTDDLTLRAPLVAHLTFGAGAETESVEVDWLNGTTLSVPAGSLTIDAEYPDLDSPGNPQANVDQHVGVMLAMGDRAASAGDRPLARLTRRLGQVGGGIVTPVVSVVPPRAQSVMLTTSEPNDYGSYELLFRPTASPTTGASRAWSVMRPAADGELVLPNGTRSIMVRNYAANADLELIYGIAL